MTYEMPGFWIMSQPNLGALEYIPDQLCMTSNNGNFSRPGAAVCQNVLMVLNPNNSNGLSFSYLTINIANDSGTLGFTYNPSSFQGSSNVDLSACPWANSARLLARIETPASGVPVALVVATRPTEGPVTGIYQVPITYDGSGIPSAGALTPITMPNGPTEALWDFTTANVDNLVFMFWVEDSGNGCGQSVFYSAYDPSTNSASSPQVLPLNPAITSTQWIHSIDATCIMAVDGSGNQSSQLVLTALVQDTSDQSVNNGMRLVSAQVTVNTGGGAASLVPVANPLPMPAYPAQSGTPTPQDSVRVCWGNLTQSDAAANYNNALMLVWTVSGGDPYFNEQFGSFEQSCTGYGPTYSTAISLDPPTYGQTPGWQDARVNNFVVDGAAYEVTLATDTWESVLFPFTVTNNGYATYYVGFIQTIICVEHFNSDSFYVSAGNSAGSMMVLELFASFNFQPPVPDNFSSVSTAADSSWSQQDVATAVSSWVLIGNIAGLPPYYPDQNPAVSLQVGLASSTGATFSASTGAAIKLSGSIGPVHGSFTSAVKRTNTYSGSTTVTVNNQWQALCGSNSGLGPNTGILLYACPNYYYGNFTITSIPSGNPTGLDVTVMYPGGGGTCAVYYDITSPNTPLDSSFLAQAVSQFPTPLLSWDASNTLPDQNWVNLPPLLANNYNNYYVASGMSPNSNEEAASQTITFSKSGSYTSEGTISVSVGVEVTALAKVFKFDATGTLDFSVQTSVQQGSSEVVSITYPTVSEPDTGLTITPYFFYPNAGSQAAWVPAPNAAQTPWLLTWTVSEYDPGAGSSR